MKSNPHNSPPDTVPLFRSHALLAEELVKGLVLCMLPEVLVDRGAVPAYPNMPLEGPARPFVLLDRVDENRAYWVGLSTHSEHSQWVVLRRHKTGHPGWTDKMTFWSPRWTILVPDNALLPAAIAGTDRSSVRYRNWVDPDALPDIKHLLPR